MQEKLNKLKAGWINDQISLIGKLSNEIDKISPIFKDKKEKDILESSEEIKRLFTILNILRGHNGALSFRLKNTIHIIKELTGETILLPEKIEDIIKPVIDIISINNEGDIVDTSNNNYSKLVDKLLAASNK
jgi:hypothetical protein